MKNYHILKVSYIGATNTRGSRVKITSERFEESIFIPYNHMFNNSLDVALNYLKIQGFEVIGQGEGKDWYYIISETFKELK